MTDHSDNDDPQMLASLAVANATTTGATSATRTAIRRRTAPGRRSTTTRTATPPYSTTADPTWPDGKLVVA